MSGVEYNQYERALSCEINRMKVHIRYYHERIEILEQEVADMRRKINDSLITRGIDPEKVPYGKKARVVA